MVGAERNPPHRKGIYPAVLDDHARRRRICEELADLLDALICFPDRVTAPIEIGYVLG